MKKIIILLISISFLITGCFDYKDVNKLAFISAIGIDYNDDKYTLTFEVLTGQNFDSESGEIKPYTVSAEGKSIAQAFSNISSSIPMSPHFFHLRIVVISQDAAENSTKDIIDYITRNPEISNNFYFLLAKDSTAKDIIEFKPESKGSIADTITDLVEFTPDTQNIIFTNTYVSNLETYLNFGIDSTITTIEKDDKLLKVSGISLFKESKYIKTLDKEESALLSSLINKESNYLLEKKDNDKTFTINIYKTEATYTLKEDKIKMAIKLNAEIKLNEPNYNLKDDKIYTTLNEDFSKKAKKKYEDLLKTIKETKTDPLGISNKYYKKTGHEYKNYFFDKDVDINIKLNINRNGFTYEANYE